MSLIRISRLMMMFVGAGGSGGGNLRMRKQIRVHIPRHNQRAPHDLIMAGEGADVFVIALGGGGGKFKGLGIAGIEEFGGGKNIGRGGNIRTPGGVELPGFHFCGGFTDSNASVGFDEDEVVRHEVAVLETNLERLAGFDDE